MKAIIAILLGANLIYCMALYHKQPETQKQCYTLSADEAELTWRMAKLIAGDNYHPAIEPPPRKPI